MAARPGAESPVGANVVPERIEVVCIIEHLLLASTIHRSPAGRK
jgi:hypothetical protein